MCVPLRDDRGVMLFEEKKEFSTAIGIDESGFCLGGDES